MFNQSYILGFITPVKEETKCCEWYLFHLPEQIPRFGVIEHKKYWRYYTSRMMSWLSATCRTTSMCTLCFISPKLQWRCIKITQVIGMSSLNSYVDAAQVYARAISWTQKTHPWKSSIFHVASLHKLDWNEIWYVHSECKECSVLVPSVRDLGCSCARGNQKSRRTTKNTNKLSDRQPGICSQNSPLYVYGHQTPGRTTRNCKLVVSGPDKYLIIIPHCVHGTISKHALVYLYFVM